MHIRDADVVLLSNLLAKASLQASSPRLEELAGVKGAAAVMPAEEVEP